MSEVPPDLYFDILSRVLAESLLRFRCVCKTWRRIIDDPSFIKLHIHRQSKADQLIFYNDIGTMHSTLPLDSLDCYSSKTPTGKVVVTSPLKTLIWSDLPRLPYLHLASCNGLILISSSFRKVWALCNPLTREAHKLPSYTSVLSKNQEVGSSCIAFGYDSISDDYKVVKIVGCYNRTAAECRFLTLVYSLKSNSWRRVKDCPFSPWLDVPGVFVNDAVHWINGPMTDVKDGFIVAFDLATEDFYTLPLPSILARLRGHLPILRALGERLLVTWHGSVYCLDDYGGENSWTKLFSFTGMGLGDVRPIAYLKSKGKVLLEGHAKKYFWFDIQKKSARKVTIDGALDCNSSQTCMASLVRLSNIDGVDGSGSTAKGTRKRKKRTPEDRLNLTITTTDIRKFTDADIFCSDHH